MEDAGAGSRSSAMAAVGAEDEEGAMGDVFCTYTDVVSREESMDGWTCIHSIGTESGDLCRPLCGWVACVWRVRRGDRLILHFVSPALFPLPHTWREIE